MNQEKKPEEQEVKKPKPQKKLPPKVLTAQKRDKQNQKRQQRRKSSFSKIKTNIKSFSSALQKQEKSVAQSKLSVLYNLLDKGANKKLVKKNKANRLKSKLTALLKGKAS